MVDTPIFELGREPGINENSQDPSTFGHFVCIGPPLPPGIEETQNRYSNLDFTGAPGEASELYFSMVFQLPKWGWWVVKADEWIEVSPTHKEYYDRTVATKQMLESTIKTGLSTAAQSVADYELMSHDIRKYKEILDYFHKKDEHLLRSMFTDQVDVYTDLPGNPISLRSVVSKWPTIISDFMRLNDNDTDPEKIAKAYDVSKAEAVILTTKNKLYKEWKTMFLTAVKERYMLLQGLVAGRKKSIIEYKEWLKPYIARFKMTKIGGERSSARAETLKSFTDIVGVSTFTNKIRLFAWKPMKFAEHRKPAAEIIGDFVLDPYDDYVRERLVLGPKGLASLYPWLNHDRKYCRKCKKYYPSDTIKCEKCHSINLENKKYADEIIKTEIIPSWKRYEMGLDPREIYYMFFDIEITRMGSRIQTGEMEDMVIYTRIFILSQNAMLVKILELKCRDMEMENYIDEMLGIKFEDKDISELVKEEFPEIFEKKEQKLSGLQEYTRGLRETFNSYTDIFSKIRLPKIKGIMFFKGGKYEADLKERLTKQYCKYAASHLGMLTEFLKQKMGVE